VYGEPSIDNALEEIRSAFPPGLSMETVLAAIESELDSETSGDALAAISGYSQQFALIKRLKGVLDELHTHSLVNLNYISLSKTVGEMGPPTDFLEEYAELAGLVSGADYHGYRALHSLLTHRFRLELSVAADDERLHSFLQANSGKLQEIHQQTFLQRYRENPSLLRRFSREMELAFSTKMPFERLFHIQCAYESLPVLLQAQGIGEIGADQLVPFAILATVIANPIGLVSTRKFFLQYIEAAMPHGSPLSPTAEYCLIQFMSTGKLLIEKMNEMETAAG
jgi:hypothetical protein